MADFKCKDCGETYNMEKRSEHPKCPKCGSKNYKFIGTVYGV